MGQVNLPQNWENIMDWRIVEQENIPVIKAAAYTIGDVVGGLQTLSVQGSTGGGFVHNVRITDAGNQKPPLTIYYFSAVPTAILDDAAFTPAIADLKKCIGILDFASGNWVTVNSLGIGVLSGKDKYSAEFIHFENLPDAILRYYIVCQTAYDAANLLDLTVYHTLYLL